MKELSAWIVASLQDVRTPLESDVIRHDDYALGRDGVLPRDSAKRYELRPAVVAYCDHCRLLAKGKNVDTDLAAAKLPLAQANAEKAETANAKARGELIPAGDVEREWSSVLRGVRAAMLALPSRVAQRLGHLNPRDIAAVDREVRDALYELTETGESNVQNQEFVSRNMFNPQHGSGIEANGCGHTSARGLQNSSKDYSGTSHTTFSHTWNQKKSACAKYECND